jgi:hypothetical protein
VLDLAPFPRWVGALFYAGVQLIRSDRRHCQITWIVRSHGGHYRWFAANRVDARVGIEQVCQQQVP